MTMSQRDTPISTMDELEHVKNKSPNSKPGFHTEPGDVWQALKDADRPLSTADLQQITHHQQGGVRSRIGHLLDDGKIEKRTDGPDGRIVYYQPKEMEFEWDNDES